MSDLREDLASLIREKDRLHERHELAGTVGPDWYEPGMMEYLEQSDGKWDENTRSLMLRFESKGVRYDGRTELLERLQVGDIIQIQRDNANNYNHNNFILVTNGGENAGNMPAELCNAIAPLFDAGALSFERSVISYVEPISKRSRYARQGILFVELICKIHI